MYRIAVFASGSGSNAERLVLHFQNNPFARVHGIFTNNAKAGVVERAARLNVPCTVFSKAELNSAEGVLGALKEEKIDFIVLAGFLLLMPENIIHLYQRRMINLHPALLPAFGGKGFYGEKVHEAVIRSGAIMSGITIHYVNEKFDEGEIIFQAACHVDKDETAHSLAGKIHILEYAYLPVVTGKLIQQLMAHDSHVSIHTT